MQSVSLTLTDKLQEIVDLETEIKLQERKYNSLLSAGESLEIVREIWLKIKHLKIELKSKAELLRLYPIR